MISIVVAVIGLIGSVTAALITTHRAGPAGTAAVAATIEGGAVPVAGQARISRSVWLGAAGLVLWLIPLLAYCVVLPGLYIGIREQGGPRRYSAAGIGLCALSLLLAVINSAIGAYQGAHGTGWWQH